MHRDKKRLGLTLDGMVLAVINEYSPLDGYNYAVKYFREQPIAWTREELETVSNDEHFCFPLKFAAMTQLNKMNQ